MGTFRRFLLLVLAVIGMSSSAVALAECQPNLAPQLVETVLRVPLDSLIIDADGLFIDFEGNLLAVNSMEKSGDMWVVRAAAGKCGNGHFAMCPRCGGCSVSRCPYYCSCANYKSKA